MQTQTYEILYSLMNIKYRHLSRRVWCSSKYANFYLGGGRFESCLYTDCPKILWLFLGPPRQITRKVLLLGHDCFLQHFVHLTIHRSFCHPLLCMQWYREHRGRKTCFFFFDTVKRLTKTAHRKYFVLCQLPVFLYSGHRIYESISTTL